MVDLLAAYLHTQQILNNTGIHSMAWSGLWVYLRAGVGDRVKAKTEVEVLVT